MLDQYGAEPFEQQQFGTAGIEGVRAETKVSRGRCKNFGPPRGPAILGQSVKDHLKSLTDSLTHLHCTMWVSWQARPTCFIEDPVIWNVTYLIVWVYPDNANA